MRGIWRKQIRTDYQYLCNESFHSKTSQLTLKPQDPKANSPDLSPHISFKNSWENLVKDQSILPLVINLIILITFTLDDLLMLLGENWCWSLLGPKRLTSLLVHEPCPHLLLPTEIFVSVLSLHNLNSRFGPQCLLHLINNQHDLNVWC